MHPNVSPWKYTLFPIAVIIVACPAILSSLPALSDESFLNGPYAANQIEGLASTLNKKDYKTAFFHGGKNLTGYAKNMLWYPEIPASIAIL